MRARLILALAFLAALLPASPAAAQDEASARALLTTVFGLYGKGGKGADYKGGYFHSSLVALVDADVKAAGSDIPASGDGDPVCDCQEWNGFWVLKMNVTMETPQRAQAVVTFAIYAPGKRPRNDSRTIQYTLVPEHGQWRIWDISYLTEPGGDPGAPSSLRQRILKDIDFYAHQPKP